MFLWSEIKVTEKDGGGFSAERGLLFLFFFWFVFFLNFLIADVM